jgi:hypothetical protein
MPTINFPSGPSLNDSYNLGTRTWKWNGEAWALQPLTGGFTGSQGAIGYTGSAGALGYSGSKGDTGTAGALGYSGSKGDLGYSGSAGADGAIGYTGSTGASAVNGTTERFTYTISGTPTTVSGNDNSGNTLAYDNGLIDVFLNGIKMVNGTDVTVTSGTSVVFAESLTNGDVVDITTFGVFNITGMNASNLSSGTVPEARLPVTTFMTNVLNDLSTIALRSATTENAIAYNTNSSFVDVFQDSSGIASHTTSARNASEYVSTISSSEAYETGDRRSSYTVTAENITIAYGPVSNSVNGVTTGDQWYWTSGTNSSGDAIVWDLGSGNSKIYTGAKWYQENSNSNGNWVWQGSNNGSSWTDLNAGFDLGGATLITQEWSNTTAYRYIRLRAVSGSRSDSMWQRETEFKVLTLTVNTTGNFISNTITAPTSTSSMGAIITYENASGTNALNTDIILQLSADNGSNFTTATLTALPNYSTGIKMAKVNNLSVTAGTQLKYKISFANQSASKEARIKGVSLQY